MAMLEEEELSEAILLVFANKQDFKGALNAQQVLDLHMCIVISNHSKKVSEALGLPDIKNRQWSIQETSALKGAGLFEGFDWYVVFDRYFT